MWHTVQNGLAGRKEASVKAQTKRIHARSRNEEEERWESSMGSNTNTWQLTGCERPGERRQRWRSSLVNLRPKDEVFTPSCDSPVPRSFCFPGIYFWNFYVSQQWIFKPQFCSCCGVSLTVFGAEAFPPTADINRTQCDHFWLIGLHVYHLSTTGCQLLSPRQQVLVEGSSGK